MTTKHRLEELEKRVRAAHPTEVEKCTLYPGEDLLTKYGPARPGVTRIVCRIIPRPIWPGREGDS
jgi:hypothetical protein